MQGMSEEFKATLKEFFVAASKEQDRLYAAGNHDASDWLEAIGTVLSFTALITGDGVVVDKVDGKWVVR